MTAQRPYAPLLTAIAERLGVPVDTFFAAAAERVDPPTAERLATVLALDPQFQRIARAYLDVQDLAGRRAIADAVTSIAGAFSVRQAARGGGA